MEQFIWLTQGLQASGKSTWAKEMVRLSKGKIKRVNKDSLRKMLDTGKTSSKKEKLVISLEREMTQHMIELGYSVVVDNTHLGTDNKHVLFYERLAQDLGVEFKIMEFDTSLYECLVRNHLRNESVPMRVLLAMGQKYREAEFLSLRQRFPSDDLLIKHLNDYLCPPRDDELPLAVLVDIDGTLALRDSSRNIFDASRLMEDRINWNVRDVVNNLSYMGIPMFVFTAREDVVVGDTSCYELTEQWLKNNEVNYTTLVMRARGDNRADSIVKTEMYQKHIEGKYQIIMAYDDRDSIISNYRERLYVPVSQVKYGNY